ncbi:C-type lectin 37Db-like [Zeugodacus cucurbitae]|uniref:C-type lectin 37Db-like n=1 Tax=Zeugodacus cucurbitae TaxID=28588 RepID=UPI0005969BB7|nr:C-type lectin 37Db-like [Zeugodacus cucurbitae]
MMHFIQISLIFLNIVAIFVSSSDSAETDPFIQIGKKYYFINDLLKMNWFAASDYCRKLGGDLATIESHEELLALQEYILSKRVRLRQLWIDGNDLAKEGVFVSHTTGLPLTYTNWYNNNPRDTNNEDCVEVVLQLKDTQLLMNDNKCEFEFHAICQYRVPIMQKSRREICVPITKNVHCMLRDLAEAFTEAADMFQSCSQPVRCSTSPRTSVFYKNFQLNY